MAETMQDTSNVGVAKGRPGGYAVIAPAGHDLTSITDMTKTLADIVKADTEVKSLGYISEDGVEISTDTDTDDIADWAAKVVASSLSSYSESAEVTFIETRDNVLKAVYGDDNVTTADGVTTIRHNENFTDAHVFVFDCVVSSTKVKRVVIPSGRIFERDSVAMNSSDVMGYKPTIKCMPYEGFDGDTYREYVYDTTVAATAATE